MAIADDFSIAGNGDIRYTGDAHGGGSPGYYTVLELHRYLQAHAYAASESGDDLMSIVRKNPSDRSTDKVITLQNGYNIDDTAAEHLYGGSITQADGDTVYAGVQIIGSVESGTELEVVQDNALLSSYWGTGLNADAASNIIMRLCIKVRADGVDIDGKRLRIQARELGDTYDEFSVTTGIGESVAAISTAVDLNNPTAAGTIATWTSVTNVEGYQQIDLNNGNGDRDYYSKWTKGTQTINEMYERTKWTARRGTSETLHGMNGSLFRGITHQWGYDAEAGTDPATNDAVAWGLKVDYDNEASGPFTVGEAITIGGDTTKGRILALDDNGTTGTMIVSVELDGTPADNDQIVGLTSGATADVNGAPVGQATGGGMATLLAVDDNGTTGTVWVQLTTGTAPADNAVCYNSTDATRTLTVNGSVTQRTVSAEFVGTSTGSSIIGAFGIGIDSTDLTASDQLFDLTNTQQVPPNQQSGTVTGLVVGEDYVLVGPNDGADEIDLTQLTLNGAHASGATTVVVNESIPSDTPASGSIRVQRSDGAGYAKVSYDSWSGSTFTLPGTLGFAADGGDGVFISYIDLLATATSESFTATYASDRSLVVKVRDGGASPIKPFITPATFGDAGFSVAAIRTADV